MAEPATPAAVIKLDGHTVSRGPVANDWGTRLQWKILRDGKEIATPNARAFPNYTHADATPGQYEVVLETWRHDGYKGNKGVGEYVVISNKVTFKL